MPELARTEKKDYKTLYYKQGKMWVGDNLSNKNPQSRLATNYLSRVRTSIKEEFSTEENEKISDVSRAEFEELKFEMEEIKQLLTKMQKEKLSISASSVIKDTEFQLRKVKGIIAVINKSENSEIIFQVSSNDFSAEMLRELAVIENNLARKYIDFSFDISPVLLNEDFASDQ